MSDESTEGREPRAEWAMISRRNPGEPCVDCGEPSIDGWWCQGCHTDADEYMDAIEQERIAAGIARCNWFERAVAALSRMVPR